jgi:iron complex outermembrane receptor protein
MSKSKLCALWGASAIALEIALPTPFHSAYAQTNESSLPPVTVQAPPRTVPKRAARKPPDQRRVASRQAKPRTMPAAQTSSAATADTNVTASAARAGFNQAPVGQTATTIDRSLFENKRAFSVADLLGYSPGIDMKQGNGPRDIGISIRGSNARNGFGIRNIVIFDDGFPVTQPDGLSRSDLVDPHAYGAIDVIRGPSSALYGNYATGGALNFRTRPGGTINGFEYGVEGGSFGYLNNYLTAGQKIGNFEASLFASDARGGGFIQNSWFNTQTVNFLATLQATPDDRITFKLINNDLDTSLPIRLSLNQFYLNPFQIGCQTPATPGCGTVSLFNNGFNGAKTVETALQAGLGREDRRTIVGARWEHDFDNTTTWRNQFVFDDRNINQPTGSTSAIGDYPSYNFMSDVTKRGELFGMDSTTLVGGWYNTLSTTGYTFNLAAGGNARLGLLQSTQFQSTTNYGLRAREELKLIPSLTAVAGIGWETTDLNGVNTAFKYPVVNNPAAVTTLTTAVPQYQNTAPEFALVYKPDTEWQYRARVATGYGTPQVSNLFVLSNGQSGNNTSLQTQTNLGYDLGVDWTPNKAVAVSATGFYEFFNNELVTQATPSNSPNATFTFNAPHSEHHGVELAAQWGFYEGWQLTAAYTRLDEVYTDYIESISGFTFNRDGNKIPGISPNELTARLGYDELHGALTGLGGFVELVWKDSFYMDNANLLKAPGYELVNINLHYKTDLTSDYFRQLTAFFEVRNVFDTTYIASANNIANTVTGAGVQNPGSVLAATQTGSIYAGSPRAFVAGMKLAFR